jgi:molecular chaperone GrpE
MPKKKKDQPKEEIIDPETPANDKALEDEGQNDDAETEQALSDVEDRLEDESIPPEEKLELIKAAWEVSEAKAAEYLDGWQRAKAEFANYKKRVIRDREQYNQEAVGKVVKNYLSAVDDLERALKNIPQNEESAAWANGIELIYRKLITALENDGVTPMDLDGKTFDPNQHEAVAKIESADHESGQIVDVIQTGYMIGNRVLRPARVCIAA